MLLRVADGCNEMSPIYKTVVDRPQAHLWFVLMQVALKL